MIEEETVIDGFEVHFVYDGDLINVNVSKDDLYGTASFLPAFNPEYGFDEICLEQAESMAKELIGELKDA